MTAQVSDANFQTEVLDSQQPVLVDFWAPWCGPCKAFAPIVDEIGKEYDGRLKVVKADVGQAPLAAVKYKISSIPHVIVMDGGEIKAQLPGLRTKQELVDACRPYLTK